MVVTKRMRETAAAEQVASDTGAQLVSMREAPDAELRDENGRRVGLEIVSVVDQEYLDSHRRLVETTSALDAERARRGIGCYATVGYDLSTFGSQVGYRSHKNWLRDLKVLDLLERESSGEMGSEELQAEGIERIAWLSWQPSRKPGIGWGYRQYTARGPSLVEVCLAKKDEMLESYRGRNPNRFDEFWLAIDSFGPGTVEDGGFAMLLERRFHARFDRVFLLRYGSPGRHFDQALDVTPRKGTDSS